MSKYLNIEKPCPEKWENMKIGVHSRFCENCQKNVMDFTNKSREEILAYILTHRNQKVCGRVKKSQLDFSHADILITIQALSNKQKNANLSFYLLTLSTLILVSCNHEASNKSFKTFSNSIVIQKEISSEDTTKIDSLLAYNKHDTTQNKTKNAPPEISHHIVSGELMIIPDTVGRKSEPYLSVDVMPEFKGGYDSLVSYIKQNLNYPEWESKNKIEGNVYVKFIVDKRGKIKNPKILRSVKNAKNFDKEVLRVVNDMPKWTPGKHEGKPVDVQFNLPIAFKL